ncbi:MAG: hypothetical protein D6767_01895 [Candidatus Hydrogenedentota bacterium]|nr:MAG: hypothetical protein D6767_01895 [Candidatus Hydrogenedentota bacterium]
MGGDPRAFIFSLVFSVSFLPSCYPSSQSINFKMEKALLFIASRQREDGSFRNFYGETHTFLTGHGLLALGSLKKCGMAVPQAQKTISYLLAKSQSSLWSFDNSLPPDADDTALVLRGLHYFLPKEKLFRYADKLASLQKENGSWPTWLAVPKSKKQKQLLRGKVHRIDAEVQAHVLLALAIIDSQRYQKNISKGIKFFKKQNLNWQKSSSWYVLLSYPRILFYRALLYIHNQNFWQEESLFLHSITKQKLSFLEKSSLLPLLKNKYLKQYTQYRKEILSLQNPDGSWPAYPYYTLYPKEHPNFSKFVVQDTLLSTALVLNGLCN